MSTSKNSEFIFEQPHRSHVWRVQLCDFEGRTRASFWPWYRTTDGELMPCNANYIKSGLQMPPERLWALGEAIMEAKAGIESSNA